MVCGTSHSSMFVLFGILLLGPTLCWTQLWTQPEQVHISYAGDPTNMFITWVTQSQVDQSLVEYGIGHLNQVARGKNATRFRNGGSDSNHTSWIHRVLLSNLSPGQKYVYHVGSECGWSDLYSFTAMTSGSAWSPRLAVFGDMGNRNAHALPLLQKEAQKGTQDAILHIGDFAYDLNDDDGYVGDAFMQQIEPIAAYIPYMTCPGNHEAAFNFSHYKNRFTMPGGYQNMYYSFAMGPALIIAFSTEVFYEKEGQTLDNIVTQYNWLQAQLQEANKPESRAAHPWIITIGHRPMYCSDNDMPPGHCNNPVNPIRVGLGPKSRAYSLEDLFYKYGVDIQFYGHEHSYERMWPVYDKKVCNGSRTAPYTNPRAPVHIVTGSAGNPEGQTPFDNFMYPWSSFRSDDYGYTRMTIHNASHLSLEQLSTNKGGAIPVIDKMTLIKEKRGAGLYNCHKNTAL